VIDYSKLAILLIRLAGLYAICVGLLSLVFSASAFVIGGSMAVGPNPLDRWLTSAYYFAGAFLLIYFSSRLGRLLAAGLR
jgi:hypothetical protein